ncbi:MAG: aminotransferase class I/II-fold pyridoxal phosphate-dependent enzyme [Nitrospirales bacterium]
MQPNELRSAISPRTRAIILNTPHNPSGHVFTKEELTAILALAEQHGIYVVTDEIYDHLYYEPYRHIAPATLAPNWNGWVAAACQIWRRHWMASRLCPGLQGCDFSNEPSMTI